jgi:hypothetical protein
VGTTKSRQFHEVRQEYLKRSSGNQMFTVMCEGGGVPTVLHKTFGAAAYEAARLAHENPGFRFHVLASQRVSVAPAVTAEAEAA